MSNTALSIAEYNGDGTTTQFTIHFEYLDKTHVKCLVDGVEKNFTWLSPGLVQVNPAPTAGSYIQFYRNTSPSVRLVDYATPGTLTEEDLDTDSKQAFYLAQEANDTANRAVSIDRANGHFTAGNRQIKNVADPTDALDVTNKQYVDSTLPASVSAAAGSAAAAAGSAAAAANSASSAENFAVDANNSKNAAAAAVSGKVDKTSDTGSVKVPSGTTAERDSTPAFGYQRANSTTNAMEWWDGSAWVPMGGGATGGVGNAAFYENDTIITVDYTITTGKNAMTAGPVSIANGVTVTIPDGSVWTVI